MNYLERITHPYNKSNHAPTFPFILIASSIGNIVEWYSFLAYGYLTTVISTLFFPQFTSSKGVVLAFLIFAAGFLSRPIGAVIFGYLGDKIGRQKTLIASQAMMAIPSFLICILPTYHQIGIYAAIMLTICRVFQGIAIGGEYTNSLCYIAEIAPPNKRGLFISIIPASTALGILLSSLITFAFIDYMSSTTLYTWGWRIIFFVGFVLCLFSVWMRYYLPESFDFIKSQHQNKKTELSFLSYFLNIPALMSTLIMISLAIVYAYLYQLLYIWAPTFIVTTLNFNYNVALLLNSGVMLLFLLSIVIGGLLVDYFNSKKVILMALLVSLFTFISFTFFPNIVLYIHSLFTLLLFFSIISITFGIFVGGCSVFFAEIFPIEIRSRSLSIFYNIPFAIVGGLTPTFLEWLVTKSLFLQIAYCSIGIALLGLFSTFFIKDKVGNQLNK